MPHTKSAKKRLRQNEKRRLRNRAAKRTLKTHIKRFEEALEEDTLEEARVEFSLACKKLDKAAARRVVHPNLASRKKSQMARALHKKEKEGAAPPPA
jgi:small subunit ribosomal protein S20